MLAADKLQLQSALKQQAVALKEKEFQLHHSNLMTVGTQAAVLAGLDITMFIEFAPPSDTEWQEDYRNVAFYLRVIYYAVIVAAFCANMIVVSHTTALSVLGAGMALRGPDGSMMTATDGLYDERRSVFVTFGFGLACTVGSVLISVWLLLPWQIAAICWCVTVITCRTIYGNYKRVVHRFGFDESETVDFRDIMEGPALATLGRTILSHLGTNKDIHLNGIHQSATMPPQSSSSSSSWRLFRKQQSSDIDNNTNSKRNHHNEWDGHSFHDEQDLEMMQTESLISTASSLSGGGVSSNQNHHHRRRPTANNNNNTPSSVRIV